MSEGTLSKGGTGGKTQRWKAIVCALRKGESLQERRSPMRRRPAPPPVMSYGACCNVDTVRTSCAIDASGYDAFLVRTAAPDVGKSAKFVVDA